MCLHACVYMYVYICNVYVYLVNTFLLNETKPPLLKNSVSLAARSHNDCWMKTFLNTVSTFQNEKLWLSESKQLVFQNVNIIIPKIKIKK